MNSRKDIFTAFQEGSEQLTVQPSVRAWQRLEQRLEDRQKRSGRIVTMRWVAAIAAAVVIILGVFFIEKSNNSSMAGTSEPSPKLLEDLVTNGNCNPYCLYVKERKSLPDYYANPVRH